MCNLEQRFSPGGRGGGDVSSTSFGGSPSHHHLDVPHDVDVCMPGSYLDDEQQCPSSSFHNNNNKHKHNNARHNKSHSKEIYKNNKNNNNNEQSNHCCCTNSTVYADLRSNVEDLKSHLQKIECILKEEMKNVFELLETKHNTSPASKNLAKNGHIYSKTEKLNHVNVFAIEKVNNNNGNT